MKDEKTKSPMMTMGSEDQFKIAANKIKNANRLLVLGHINPDGDAISAVNAIALIAQSFNRQIDAFCINKKDEPFSFLPFTNKISNSFSGKLSDYDVVVVVDCGALSRTGIQDLIEEELKKTSSTRPFFIEFDHHPQVHAWADLEIRQPELSATCEVIYRFCKSQKIKFDRDLADSILTGILTDTGNFFYPNTSSETITIASKMMEFGARFAKISSWLKNNQDLLTIKLWGLALENLRFNPRYGFAFSVLTREDLKTAMMAAGHQDAVLRNDFSQILHSDLFGDIAGFLSNISGAKAVMLLRQDAPGKLKGGLRTSSSDIDISLLARQLGGGGHAKASGFELAGDLEKTDEGWRVV